MVLQINSNNIIGECIQVDNKTYYLKGASNEGYIYKDYNAFKNEPDKVCYIPEYADEVEIGEHSAVPADSEDCYTKKKLLELCHGNKKLCEDLFSDLEWTYPETLLNEWGND